MMANVAPEGLLTLHHSANLDFDMATLDQIDLAHASAFRLGPITVEPALRQVIAARSETLEPRVMQVLVALAMANGGIVSRDDLVRQCWEGRIVGDDSISRVIARLRKLAEDHADGAFRIETITKVGYRLVGPVVLTATTSRPPLATEAPEPPAIARRRQRWMLAVAAVVVAVLAVLVWRIAAPSPKPLQTTLRLGEFKPIGAGVTANLPASIESELRSAFGANSAVQVTTRNGDYLLQGDVRHVGERLRYTVHLDDIDNGAVLWTGSTDYPEGSELAARQFAIGTSGVVRCALSNTATYPGRLSVTALSLYLQSCWERSSLVQSWSIGRDIYLLRRLTAVAPDFSYGWSALASIDTRPPEFDAADTGSSRAEAVAALKRALELDPRNAEAYSLQAWNLPPSDFAGREKILKHALTLRPSDCGCEYERYSGFLMLVGRFKDSAVNARRAIDQQPNALAPMRGLASGFYFAGDIAAGDEAMAKLDEIYADEPDLATLRFRAAMQARRWNEAEQRLDDVVNDKRLREAYTAAFKALRTDEPASRSAAIASLRDVIMIAPDRLVTLLLAELGARDAALVSAAHISKNGGYAADILMHPMLASVRSMPGYLKLLEEYGLMTYWRTTGTRPDFCTEPSAPAFCRSLA